MARKIRIYTATTMKMRIMRIMQELILIFARLQSKHLFLTLNFHG